MTYKIQKSGKKFKIVELATEKVIIETNDHDSAHQIYLFFKNGGGFDGWTPDFVAPRT